MKTRLFQFVAIAILLALVTTVSTASGTKSNLAGYTITAIDNKDVMDGFDKAWNLTYDAKISPILITFKENKKCRTYFVRGENFEVIYECSHRGFGARKVKKAESMLSFPMSSSALNLDELANQRILAPGRVDIERALGLIASYLPDLVKMQN